jgi:hypothetical protein
VFANIHTAVKHKMAPTKDPAAEPVANDVGCALASGQPVFVLLCQVLRDFVSVPIVIIGVYGSPRPGRL